MRANGQHRRVAPPPEKTRIVFVDIGRAVAALTVFYVHIDIHFLRPEHGELLVPSTIEALGPKALGMSTIGLGQVAVALFFLISGFVVTPIAMKMGARRFAVNRAFRVYPLLAVVVILSALAFAARIEPVTEMADTHEITAGTLLSNLTLVNFWIEPFRGFAVAAWTLAVEVIFYALLIALLPLLRRWVWAAIAVELEVVAIVVLLRGEFGLGYHGIAAQAAYLLIPIIGQVLWAGLNQKMPAWLTGTYLAVIWAMLVWAADARIDVFWALNPLAIALATLLFLVGWGLESRLRQRQLWTALSERSYSLYLVHGLVVLPVLHALNDHLPLPLTLLLAIAATAVSVQVTYLFVERPSHQLGRRLSRSPARSGATRTRGSDRPGGRPRRR